jgi:hypothetical protein
MSVEKLTWYYWDQDRFGNLLPFLASPIRPIGWNFAVQVFLRNVLGFLAIWCVLDLAGERDRREERFYLAVLLLMLAAGPLVVRFFGHALPQPQSLGVFAIGLWLLRRQPRGRGAQCACWLAATAAFWLAFFVNLSLVVLAVPLAFVLWAAGGREAGPLGRIACVVAVTEAAALAWLHARQFDPQTPAALRPRLEALGEAARALLSPLDLAIIAALPLAALAFVAVASGLRLTSVRPLRHLLLLAMLAAAASFYASLAWVQANGNDARYYSMMTLALVVLPASWTITLAPQGPWRRALPLVALLAVALRAGAPGPLRFNDDDPARPFAINQDAGRVLDLVPPDRPMLVVGRYGNDPAYWKAVPLVYARLDRQGQPESYATVNHWAPMRETIAGLLRSGRAVTLVCVDVATDDCVPLLEGWTGVEHGAAHGARTARIVARGTFAGGGPFAVLDVTAAGP